MRKARTSNPPPLWNSALEVCLVLIHPPKWDCPAERVASAGKKCDCWRVLGICAGSIFHVHSAWQVWDGQIVTRYHPVFNSINQEGIPERNLTRIMLTNGFCLAKGLQDPTSIAFVRPVRYSPVVALTLSVVHVDPLSQKTLRRLNKFWIYHNISIYTILPSHEILVGSKMKLSAWNLTSN